MRFAPADTLKVRADFQRLRQARRAGGVAFMLAARDRGDGGPPRIGFTVADKAIRQPAGTGAPRRAGAVRRNRARRRLKEAARLVAPQEARAGFDYVIIGREPALRQDFAALLADLTKAFRQLHRAQAPRPPAG